MLTDLLPMNPEELSMTVPPLASTAPPLDLLVDASPRVSSLFLAYLPATFLISLRSLTPDTTQSIAPLVAGCFLHIMESCGQRPDALPSLDIEHAVAHLTSSTAAKFKWLAAGGDTAVAIKKPPATDLQQQERGGDVEEEEEEI